MMPSAALSAAMNASIVVCMFSVAAVIVTGGDAARRNALVDGEYICAVFGKNSKDGRQHALPVEQLEVERHEMAARHVLKRGHEVLVFIKTRCG